MVVKLAKNRVWIFQLDDLKGFQNIIEFIKQLGSKGAKFDPNKFGVINIDGSSKRFLGTLRTVEDKFAFKTDVAILAI